MAMKVKSILLLNIFMLIMMGQTLFAQSDAADNNANYQQALNLYNSGKAAEGIPYLENILKTNSTIKPAAYDLLGNIYDQTHQEQKAIETYQEGIKLDPAYQSLRFNLGIAYFRNKQYADAEASAIEAIKLGPKHAYSQRLYGLVTFHQNKRVNALLALCNFILMDPTGPRAGEAFTNIQSILKGGVLKPDEVVPTKDKDDLALNNGLAGIIAASKTKKLPPMELLEYQLKSVFIMGGQLSAKKTNKSFFDNHYAAFFYKLSQSPQLSTFVRIVSIGGNKDEYVKWKQDNTQQLLALDNWIATTERGF